MSPTAGCAVSVSVSPRPLATVAESKAPVVASSTTSRSTNGQRRYCTTSMPLVSLNASRSVSRIQRMFALPDSIPA